MRLKITREIDVPDPMKLDRFRRIPELGPKILFFSGGSALYDVSRALVRYTHNSIHIVTPFDSGGSSAKLRSEFDMPAIGDVRHRLMALADQSYHGNPEIFALFGHRLPKDASKEALAETLSRLAKGRHPLISSIPDPMRKLIRYHLRRFRSYASDGFDLRGASLGNLVLAAGYLDNRRHMDPVVFLFSKLVEVRGVVRPVVNRSLHLQVDLEDGTVIDRQHRFTGKVTESITSRILDIRLIAAHDPAAPVEVAIRKKTADLIREAELICFPMGSFYSSIIATLLPAGVGRAIVENACPKVFIPNTGDDPECVGMSLGDQVSQLLRYIKRDLDGTVDGHLIDIILLDDAPNRYKGELSRTDLDALGIQVLRHHLVSDKTAPYIDAELLNPVLLSLC